MSMPLPSAPESGSVRELIADRNDVRVDVWLAQQLPDISRSQIQKWIRDGRVLCNRKPCKPSLLLHIGDRVSVSIPPPVSSEISPEAIPLDILYEDADVIVLNKPPGMVVHPAPGHNRGTLVNALLHHCKDLKGIGGVQRPGIVHRLDRDTSGILVVAKNQQAMEQLATQFKNRKVTKEYWALAWGRFEKKKGRIETLIGRDPHNRKKMSARPTRGRLAITEYEVIQEFPEVSLVRVTLITGRTHQIRVHFSYIHHPIVGDRQYSRARVSKRPITAPRQMLHARRIGFVHPTTKKWMEFEAPLPDDMQSLLAELANR